jgi:hypothetical protein
VLAPFLRITEDGSRRTTSDDEYRQVTEDIVPDPNTLLLCNFDSAIADQMGRHTLTAQGNAQITTSGPKYGAGALLLDGNDYIYPPGHADFDYGKGAFTCEAWVLFSTGSRYNGFFSFDGSTVSRGAGGNLSVNTSNRLEFFDGGGAIVGGTTLSTSTWYHVALVGNGGADGSRNIKLYLNGTQEGSTYTVNYNWIITDTWIGTNVDFPNDGLIGKIDDLRISNIARYTSNFTPPTRSLSRYITNI